MSRAGARGGLGLLTSPVGGLVSPIVESKIYFVKYEALRKMLDRRPSRPIEFVLAGGEVYRADHPELVFAIPDLVVVWMPEDGRYGLFGPEQVSSLRVSNGNGTRRKRGR